MDWTGVLNVAFFVHTQWFYVFVLLWFCDIVDLARISLWKERAGCVNS